MSNGPQSSSGTSRSLRLDSIDALRGFAALFVALYHVWGHYGFYPFPSTGVVPQDAYPDYFSYLVSPLRWGYLGVSLFLVLSGFCIHLPYARRKKQAGSYEFKPRQFYLRRMWRLYPAYLISVVGCFLLLLVGSRFSSFAIAPSLTDLFTHLTFTHGFFDSYFYGIVHVYWSLALEFQLYLAYPLFLIAFRKFGLTRSIAFLTIVSLVWRYAALQMGFGLISVSETGPYSLMGCVVARMPEWLMGVWLAEWFILGEQKRIARFRLGMSTAVVLFAAILTTLVRELWVVTDIVFGLGFMLLVATAITGKQQEGKAVRAPYRALIWLGTISYTVYLFHMPLSWLTNALILKVPSDNWQFLLRLVWLGLSIPVLGWIFRYVEKPFLRLPNPDERYFGAYQWLRRVIGIKTDAAPPVQLGSSAS